MYGMIQLARMAAIRRPDARICALTWTDDNGMDLRSFLGDVVGIKWHSLVDEKDRRTPVRVGCVTMPAIGLS